MDIKYLSIITSYCTMIENQCLEQNIRIKVSNLSVVNLTEVVVSSLLLLTMVAILLYVIIQIKSKNIWEDLKGKQRILLQALMCIIMASGILYLFVGCAQIVLYSRIKKGDVKSSLFNSFYQAYFVSTILIGLLMNNILLCISYLWEHIITSYFQKRKRTLFLIFMGIGLTTNALIILGIFLNQFTELKSFLWYVNICGSLICAGVAIVISIKFIHRLKKLGTAQRMIKTIKKQVWLLAIASGVRILYNFYIIIDSLNNQTLNFQLVDNDCLRIHQFAPFLNLLINFLRFFLPVLVIASMFAADKPSQQQASLYESFHQSSREVSFLEDHQ